MSQRSARPRPTLRRALAALAAAALAVAGVVAVSPASPAAAAAKPPTGPAGDAFYTPPSPLPPGKPGDVIWQRTSVDLGKTTYLVLYRSTNATGQPIAVSGRIEVKHFTDTKKAPVVAVAPGTVGLGDTCAVSRNALYAGFMTPSQLLDKGWIVATTDYEGLGTPGVHTYVVGKSEGNAVLDIARAAQNLGIGVTNANPVGVYGYSQGGGGAAWANELKPSYAPELNLKGVAAGGVPADMIAVGKALDGGLGFGFLAAAAAGFNAAYPELNLDKYLNATGKDVFAKNVDACLQDVIIDLAFHRIAEYTTTNPMEQPDWKAKLTENSLGSRPLGAPMYQWHGVVDEILPFAQGEALSKKYCAAGQPITFQATFDEHVSGLLGDGLKNSVQFLDDRFKGKPVTSTC